MAVFVDTSAFYALADRKDPAHSAMRLAAGKAVRRGFVTTDYVFIETMLLIEARLGYEASLRFWAALRGGATRLLGVLGTDLARAHTIVCEWMDQRFGVVDATSFAVIERLGIGEALSLDKHFRLYRFGPGRRRRLRVFP